MAFANAKQLGKFLETPVFNCKEKDCMYVTDDEVLFSRHAIEHTLLKAEEKRMKYEVARAKPKKELVNMLGKIIE